MKKDLKVQLRWDSQYNCWVLRHYPQSDQDEAYELYITGCSDNWHYTVVWWNMGDCFQALTKEQWKQRLKDIEEHEGKVAAKLFEANQDIVVLVKDNNPVLKLHEYWEAMMLLDLFTPHAAMGKWEGPPLNKDLQRQMREASEAEFREGLEDDGPKHNE